MDRDDFVAKPYLAEQIYTKIAEHLEVQYDVVTTDQTTVEQPSRACRLHSYKRQPNS